MKTFSVPLEEKGQITVPQIIQDELNITEGDTLTLIKLGEVLLLTPKKTQVPQLADKISIIMENEAVSLTDLLLGLETERVAISQQQQ
ncbi:MAG: AbrB/MazE/SpoVT family DNA-binding domain-containing protein [Gomphosphaeria aponina SAG 52.96 = DSM 107014]|uniref:AbrB/MazE/SpoVT family DNA-binding domain-containing protein n=1 Tax=Gomphosphaeria aponina SAG 52.96 = DSM 107014 TaxID=1521640 RepID=A0A941JVG9_9CHRO|nr:AbrB/MazE/SpoVT family DNA-binding domain-containing protein [Gomphosphaeria aponina SAG 52.96 = DSM 107014]